MHPTTTTLAPTVFARLAYLVALPGASGVQPEGRAKAIAATLRELAAIPALASLPLSPASLALAFHVLGRAGGDEPPHVEGRRATCRALSFWAEHTYMWSTIDAAEHGGDPTWIEGDAPPVAECDLEQPELEEAVEVWRAIAAHFDRLIAETPDDSRRVAMAVAYARERDELERYAA